MDPIFFLTRPSSISFNIPHHFCFLTQWAHAKCDSTSANIGLQGIGWGYDLTPPTWGRLSTNGAFPANLVTYKKRSNLPNFLHQQNIRSQDPQFTQSPSRAISRTNARTACAFPLSNLSKCKFGCLSWFYCVFTCSLLIAMTFDSFKNDQRHQVYHCPFGSHSPWCKRYLVLPAWPKRMPQRIVFGSGNHRLLRPTSSYWSRQRLLGWRCSARRFYSLLHSTVGMRGNWRLEVHTIVTCGSSLLQTWCQCGHPFYLTK